MHHFGWMLVGHGMFFSLAPYILDKQPRLTKLVNIMLYLSMYLFYFQKNIFLNFLFHLASNLLLVLICCPYLPTNREITLAYIVNCMLCHLSIRNYLLTPTYLLTTLPPNVVFMITYLMTMFAIV